jgi:hypothetical protein
MKHRSTLRTTVALCAAALTALTGQAQDTKKDPAAQKAEMDAMMKKWMEVSTPGAQHKKLEELVGTWDATATMTMAPGAPPSVSKGSSTYRAVLGGRYVMQEWEGQMMGMPMTGIGYFGYDNVNKKYVMSWIDNMGTGIATGEGSADLSGNVLSLYGKMDEFMTGEHDKNVKYVFRFLGKDKHVFELHDLAIGEPNTKVLEITYTRKK